MCALPSGPERTYHLLGVPFRTGSLYPGSENDAQAYRDAGLIARLCGAGLRAVDEGDLAIPSYLPHHGVPPIRSWPGPRIVWDLLAERIGPWLEQPGHVPLVVGCDCSVVVGTTQALQSAASGDVHVLYVDGDFDDTAPDPARCQSAAAMAVWLLSRPSSFWTGPPLRPSQVTVIGWTRPSRSPDAAVRSVPLVELRRAGPPAAVQATLDALPPAAPLLVHLDIDVFAESALPAAYFPHPDGLTLSEGAALLGAILADPRVRLVEVSEYAALRDLDGRRIAELADILTGALER